MLPMQRAGLFALTMFFPIFGFLWLGAPWFSSQANFELTGHKLFEDARTHFDDLASMSPSPAESAAWLPSEDAAKVVLDNLPPGLPIVLSEIGETWSVKLRERMRALVCYGQIDAGEVGGNSLCSWLGEWLKPETHADGIEVIRERLSIIRSDDDRHLNVSFRAANHHVATTIVDAFGNALEQRHGKAMQAFRRRTIEDIEADLLTLTERQVQPEEPPAKTESELPQRDEDADFELSLKLIHELQRARSELPANDRQQIGKELEAVKAAVREKLSSQQEDGNGSDTANEPVSADPAAAPRRDLMLLGHPDWSLPPVIRRSATTADGLFMTEIAAMALALSAIIGFALSLIWPMLRQQSEPQDQSYASPYANPHWPSMQTTKEPDPEGDGAKLQARA